jgi:hypothetical protein
MAEIQMSQIEYDKRLDRIKTCGANRGVHDYIPVAWARSETTEMVTELLCRNCLNRVTVQTLYEHFHEIRI